MFPLSHTYVSTKATGRHSPLLILGSILPDISSTSAGKIGRDQIHNEPLKFFTFIKQNFPQLSDLGLGVRLHSHVGGGADFYSDDREVGYAYVQGAKISEKVAQLLPEPLKGMRLVFAHNFIELAVDLQLYQNQREIWGVYQKALSEVVPELEGVTMCLSQYLNLEPQELARELQRMLEILGHRNFCSAREAAERVVIPLTEIRAGIKLPVEPVIGLLEEATRLTEGSYLGFLDGAVAGVSRDVLGTL